MDLDSWVLSNQLRSNEHEYIPLDAFAAHTQLIYIHFLEICPYQRQAPDLSQSVKIFLIKLFLTICLLSLKQHIKWLFIQAYVSSTWVTQRITLIYSFLTHPAEKQEGNVCLRTISWWPPLFPVLMTCRHPPWARCISAVMSAVGEWAIRGVFARHGGKWRSPQIIHQESAISAKDMVYANAHLLICLQT